jgi:DNA-binding transcriptional MerR regulator
MRMGELSRRSGVSVPTIKYYLREGLLPAGTATSPNQADYGDGHLRRLRVIRALIDVGGLSVTAAREVLAAVDDPAVTGHALLGVAHRAVAPSRRGRRDTDEWRAARAEAAAVAARRGWRVSPDAPALDQLADVITAARALGLDELLAGIDTYAEAADAVARYDLGTVVTRARRAAPGDEPAQMVETVITGTVLGESLLTGLRLLAQEAASARTFGA